MNRGGGEKKDSRKTGQSQTQLASSWAQRTQTGERQEKHTALHWHTGETDRIMPPQPLDDGAPLVTAARCVSRSGALPHVSPS